MADWGVRIRNPNSGRIQIDQNYRNLAYRESVSGSTGSKSGYQFYVGDISCTLHSSTVVAFRSSTPVALGRAQNNVLRFYSAPGDSATITVYVFDQVDNCSPVDNTVWGWRVSDASGQSTFDSRYRYLKALTYASGISGSGGYDDTISTSSNAAVVQGPLFVTAFQTVQLISNTPYVTEHTALQTISCGDGGVVLSTAEVQRGPFAGGTPRPTATQAHWSYLVVDVSGL